MKSLKEEKSPFSICFSGRSHHCIYLGMGSTNCLSRAFLVFFLQEIITVKGTQL